MLNSKWLMERLSAFFMILLIFLPPTVLLAGYTFDSLTLIETLVLMVCLIGSFGKMKINKSKINLPILCYLLSCLLSTINSNYLRGSWEELIKLASCILLFLIIGNYFSTRLKLLIHTFIWTTLIVISLSLFDFFKHIPNSLSDRLFFPLGNPNLLAGFLVITIPLMIRMVFIVRFRFLLWMLLLFSFITLFFTESRGGLLAVISAILFLFFISPFPIKQRYMLITGLVIVTGAVISWIGYFSPRVGTYIDFQRLHIWNCSWQMFLDHPILGVGLGAYSNTFFDYNQGGKWHQHSHNIFLQQACEVGIIGLLSFVWLLIILFKENRVDNYEKGVKEGLLASLIGFLIHNQVDYLLWLPMFQIYFWLIISVLTSIKAKEYVELSSKFWFPIVIILFWFFCVFTPFLGYVYFNQGVELDEQGKWAEAKVKFEKAVLFDFYHPIYHRYFGTSYTKIRPPDLASAAKEYQKAYQFDKHNPQNNCAYFSHQKGNRQIRKENTLSWKLYRRLPIVEEKKRISH